MKNCYSFILIIVTSELLIKCSETEVMPKYTGDTLEITFKCGPALSPTSNPNIYVVWAQNSDLSFIQNFTICKRLLDGSLTGTALPYWKTNVYPNSGTDEVNAVTGPTIKRTDFTIEIALKEPGIRKFKIYFEIDHSFDSNDWFGDQPALLYSADVDLDNDLTEYELLPVGWTPNENTENIISATPMGTLQSEMRYITNFDNSVSFGGSDSRSATNMVNKISLRVK